MSPIVPPRRVWIIGAFVALFPLPLKVSGVSDTGPAPQHATPFGDDELSLEVDRGHPRGDGPHPSVALAEVVQRGNLSDLRAAAGSVFLAEVEAADVRDRGQGILVTDYRLRIEEVFKGTVSSSESTLVALGGTWPDGSGMFTTESLKLSPGGHYVVFLKPGGESLRLPFIRVLSIDPGGAGVTDESGRALTGLAPDGWMTFAREREFASLFYWATPTPAGQTAPLPDVAPEAMSIEAHPEGHALLASVLGFLRGDEPEVLASASTSEAPGPEDRPLGAGAGSGMIRAQYCGFTDRPINYYTYLPSDTHWEILRDCGRAWNTLVDPNSSGSYGGNDWLLGYYSNGDEPIRDRRPTPNNNNSEEAVLSSAEMDDEGYDTWESLGNPNGVGYYWRVGAECTRIDEADVFINSAVADDDDAHHAALTKLLGAALSLQEQDLFYAIMYTGLATQHAPNYASGWYNRADDCLGVRAHLDAVNNDVGATVWVLEQWADMAVYAQTHENWGSSGSLIMADVDTNPVPAGGALTVSHFHVENRGNLPASNVLLRMFISTDSDVNAASDREIWRRAWTTYPADTVTPNTTASAVIPEDVVPGDYYVGWVLTTDGNERSTLNNEAILLNGPSSGFTQRTIQVAGPECAQPGIRIEPTFLIFSPQWPPSTDSINVEIDWMADVGHSHQPQQAEINAVIEMFACQGITLNVEIDDQLAHVQTMVDGDNNENTPDFFTFNGPNSFGAIRTANFDHAGETGWHYCIFGHDYDQGDGPGSSGLAEFNADDFVVTLGSFAGQIGTAWDRAGTFAHELGHNLGLRHAGDQNEDVMAVGRYKPNFASVMAYRYQLNGVRAHMECRDLVTGATPFRHLDYSHGTLPALDEEALIEGDGMGYGAVDWDCDGAVDGTAVAQDLGPHNWCFAAGTLSVLTDYDDWANVCDVTWGDPDWGGCTDSRIDPSRQAAEFYEPCITAKEAYGVLRGACAQPPLGGECINYPDQSFVIYNDGATPLSVTSVVAQDGSTWPSLSPAPPYMIAAGGQQPVTVSVGFTGVADGSYWETLLVSSDDACRSPYPNGVYLNLRVGPVPPAPGAGPLPFTSTWLCGSGNWPQEFCWDQLAESHLYPDNDGVGVYDVLIPGTSGTVNVNPPGDAGITVDGLEVQSGATLTVAAGKTCSVLDALTSHATLRSYGALTVDPAALVNLDNSSVFVESGGSASIPVSSYTMNIGTGRTLRANGSGSFFDLSQTQSIANTLAAYSIGIDAFSGGRVDLSSLQFSVAAYFDAEGSGGGLPSTIMLSSSPTLDGRTWLRVGNGGQILYPNLTDIGAGLIVNGPTSVIDLSLLTNIDNANIYVEAGADVAVPATSYAMNSGTGRTLRGDGAGSTFDLSNVLSIVNTLAAYDVDVEALNGGLLDLSSLQSAVAAYFDADGSGGGAPSTIVLFNSPTLDGRTWLRVGSGGQILYPNLIDIGGGLVVSGPASFLDVSQLTSIGNANIYVEAGAQVALPATGYAMTSGTGRTLRADGPGSLLDLSELQSLTNSQTAYVVRVEALAGATVDLSSLSANVSRISFESEDPSSLIRLNALSYLSPNNSLTVIAGGTILAGPLTSALRASLTVDGASSTLDLSQVTNIDESDVFAEGGASVSLPGVAAYLGSASSSSETLEANAAGSLLGCPALVSLDGRTSGNVNVRAIAGGQLSLPALASATNNVVFRPDGAASLMVLGSPVLGTGPSIAAFNGATLRVLGSLSYAMTASAKFAWNAGTTLSMVGGVGVGNCTVADFVSLEIAGADFGNSPSGFVNNFQLANLVIGSNAHVGLVDALDNGNRGGVGGPAEALYVNTLRFEDNQGRLYLRGLHLYYTALVGDSAQIIPYRFGDADGDRDLDLTDHALFAGCFTGPAGGPVNPGCEPGDFDCDSDLDLADFSGLQAAFGDP